MEDHDHHPVPMTVAVPVKTNSNATSELSVDVGTTTQVPPTDSASSQTILVPTKSGETLRIDKQVQFYAQNNQLVHPLVSPVLSYLGGLPPLLFIVSDKEVLRDETIYAYIFPAISMYMTLIFFLHLCQSSQSCGPKEIPRDGGDTANVPSP
jgi:acetyl esterase/lipase